MLVEKGSQRCELPTNGLAEPWTSGAETPPRSPWCSEGLAHSRLSVCVRHMSEGVSE